MFLNLSYTSTFILNLWPATAESGVTTTKLSGAEGFILTAVLLPCWLMPLSDATMLISSAFSYLIFTTARPFLNSDCPIKDGDTFACPVELIFTPLPEDE